MSLGKEADKAVDDYFDSIKQIPEVKTTIDGVTQFLADCESAGLLKFPNNQLMGYFENAESRAIMNIMAQSAEKRIQEKQEAEKFIPESEWDAFNVRSNVDMMRNYAEELKINLKMIINSDIIDPNINELGTYLRKIYDKLGYDETQRKNMNEIFQVYLRNALSHQDYRIDGDSMTYYDKERNPTTLTRGELGLPTMQMTATTVVFDAKTKELKSKNS